MSGKEMTNVIPENAVLKAEGCTGCDIMNL
jgi:hypothetical protein